MCSFKKLCGSRQKGSFFSSSQNVPPLRNLGSAQSCLLRRSVCVQMFQVEQRLQRTQQQLKEMRQAAADADPERKSSSTADRPPPIALLVSVLTRSSLLLRPGEEAGGGDEDQLLHGVGEAAPRAGGHKALGAVPAEGGGRARHGPG